MARMVARPGCCCGEPRELTLILDPSNQRLLCSECSRQGGLVYCLHCPEMEAPFLGFWYLIGMLILTAIGAMLGPRRLRW